LLKAQTIPSSFRVVGYYSLKAATSKIKKSTIKRLTHVNLWFLNPDSAGNLQVIFKKQNFLCRVNRLLFAKRLQEFLDAINMNITKVITAGVIGTSMMTLFSYWVSKDKDKQFREPALLAILLKRMLKTNDDKVFLLSGWIIHYKVGLIFTVLYDQFWQKTNAKPSVANGMMLGILCGLFGKEVWKTVLRLHPNPPAIDRKAYFAHLVLAHAIFGIFAAIGYRIPKGDDKLLPR